MRSWPPVLQCLAVTVAGMLVCRAGPSWSWIHPLEWALVLARVACRVGEGRSHFGGAGWGGQVGQGWSSGKHQGRTHGVS